RRSGLGLAGRGVEVGGKEGRPIGVVAAADELVEDLALELGRPALAQLVDGEHFDLRERRERHERGHIAHEGFFDLGDQEAELHVAGADAALEGEMLKRAAEQVGLAGAGGAPEQYPLTEARIALGEALDAAQGVAESRLVGAKALESFAAEMPRDA